MHFCARRSPVDDGDSDTGKTIQNRNLIRRHLNIVESRVSGHFMNTMQCRAASVGKFQDGHKELFRVRDIGQGRSQRDERSSGNRIYVLCGSATNQFVGRSIRIGIPAGQINFFNIRAALRNLNQRSNAVRVFRQYSIFRQTYGIVQWRRQWRC